MKNTPTSKLVQITTFIVCPYSLLCNSFQNSLLITLFPEHLNTFRILSLPHAFKYLEKYISSMKYLFNWYRHTFYYTSVYYTLQILHFFPPQIESLWQPCSSKSVVVLLPSCVWLFVTPETSAYQASLSLTISWSLPKFMSSESVMPSNHLILCRPLLLLPLIFPSIRVFSSDPSGGWSIGASALASAIPKRIQGWFPFKIDWFDHLLFFRTLRSILQHHSSKASFLQHSAFSIVQL